MKNIYILIFLAFCCSFLFPVQAEENLNDQSENQLMELKKLTQGSGFKSNYSSYVFLPDVFPKLKEEKSKIESANSFSSESSEENEHVIGELGEYNFTVKSNKETGLNSLKADTGSFPAAYNQKTGRLVLIPGVIKAKLKSMESADQIASQFDLGVKERFDHIRYVYFLCSPNQNIVQLAEKINQRDDVEQAEIQVVEYLQVAY